MVDPEKFLTPRMGNHAGRESYIGGWIQRLENTWAMQVGHGPLDPSLLISAAKFKKLKIKWCLEELVEDMGCPPSCWLEGGTCFWASKDLVYWLVRDMDWPCRWDLCEGGMSSRVCIDLRSESMLLLICFLLLIVDGIIVKKEVILWVEFCWGGWRVWAQS